MGDDPLEEPARLEWLGVDDQAAALGPAQDEQVLDEAVEPLRLARTSSSSAARARRVVRPAGRARIWVSPRIVVIGVRSS